MTFYQPGFMFLEKVIIAVGEVVSTAGFAVVSPRAGVLASFGPAIVITAESTLSSVRSHKMACKVQQHNSYTYERLKPELFSIFLTRVVSLSFDRLSLNST